MCAHRVLLCCETGHGRGHVTTLATVARALGSAYTFHAILPELDHAHVLAPVCARVDRGAVLARLPGRPPAGSLNWAAWLQNRGYDDPDILKAQFDWWSTAIRTVGPALVVADYAPTALLVARALGIPTVAVGAAFGLPPAGLARFPSLLTRRQAALHEDVPKTLAPQEEAIRACVNATLAPSGLPPLARLPEVYAADLSLPHGVSAWDPYAKDRTRPLVPPLDPLPPLKRGPGTEVFIYFSTRELAEPAIVEALCRLPFDASLVAPGLTPDLARQLRGNPRLTLLPMPLPPDEIVRRSRVMLCAGQAGTLALAVLSGIPVVALPVQQEQLSNALRAAARLNAVRAIPKRTRSAQAILGAVADLWEAPALGAAARLVALDLRETYEGEAQGTYSDLIRALVR